MGKHIFLSKILIIILALTTILPLRAQVPSSPTDCLTPNAMSFLRYGDIPVSLYTGTPNISIPIDTLNSGKLQLPISLSYHCAGVKPDEHPGWVGLGWTLQLGGAITREVRGFEDEYHAHNGTFSGYAGAFSSYNNKNGVSNSTSLDAIGHLYKLGYDCEPDMFNFNFGDYSGFFVLDTLGHWQVFCDRPIKVRDIGMSRLTEINGCQTLIPAYKYNGFVITDEDGMQYVFGEDAIDYSIPLCHQNSTRWTANTWHLVRIVHPCGDKIELKYQRGSYCSVLSYNYMVEFLTASNGTLLSNQPIPYGGQMLSPVYLKTVEGENLKIGLGSSESHELSYTENDYLQRISALAQEGQLYSLYYLAKGSPQGTSEEKLFQTLKWRKLDDMTIMDGSGSTLKHVSFSYNDTPQERLALMKVEVSVLPSFAEEIYQLSYNKLDKMPKYLSEETDLWGYFNGIKPTSINTAERPVNPLTADYGSLREIIYPTGGKSVLEFEPHQYRYMPNDNGFGVCQKMNSTKYAGGIRIKSITNFSEDGMLKSKHEYFYVSNYSPVPSSNMESSGILDGKICTSVQDCVYGRFHYSVASDKSLTPAVNALGQHIGYSEVVEKLPNGSYTISQFTSLLDSAYCNTPMQYGWGCYPLLRHSAKDHYRGKLKRRSAFDAQGRLMHDEITTYESLMNTERAVRGIHYEEKGFSALEPDGSALPIYHSEGSKYKVYYHKLLKKDRVIIDVDPINHTLHKTAQSFSYNSEGQLKKQVQTVSERGQNDNLSMTYQYVWETNPVFKTKNYLAYIASTIKARNDHSVEIYSNQYALNDSTPYLKSVSFSNGNGPIHQLYECFSVDRKGNPVSVVRKGIPYVYLWGHDYNTPVAEIAGVTGTEVDQKLGFQSTKAPEHAYHVQDKISLLRSQIPSAAITSYTFIPHIGITSMTDPSGKTTYYHYDLYGRLKGLQDTHHKNIKTFAYSMALAKRQNERLSLDSLLKSHYFNTLHIFGPSYLHPQESLHFWCDKPDIPYQTQWRIAGDTTCVEMIQDRNNVMLRNKVSDTDNAAHKVMLLLDIIDENGEKICSIPKNVWTERKRIDVIVNNSHLVVDGKAVLTLSINAVNHSLLVGTPIFINGIQRATILNEDSRGNGYYIKHLLVPRDLQHEFYQIAVGWNSDATVELPVSELFNEE